MKRLLFLLLISCFIGCEEDDSIDNENMNGSSEPQAANCRLLKAEEFQILNSDTTDLDIYYFYYQGDKLTKRIRFNSGFKEDSTTYSYDSLNRLISIKNSFYQRPANKTLQFNYLADGKIGSIIRYIDDKTFYQESFIYQNESIDSVKTLLRTLDSIYHSSFKVKMNEDSNIIEIRSHMYRNQIDSSRIHAATYDNFDKPNMLGYPSPLLEDIGSLSANNVLSFNFSSNNINISRTNVLQYNQFGYPIEKKTKRCKQKRNLYCI